MEDHNWDQAHNLGIIEKVWFEKNEKAFCRARFNPDEPRAEIVWKSVLGGFKRNVSVGYQIYEFEIQERDEDDPEPDLDTVRITDWEPHEISIVSVPADITVGFRDQDDGGQLYPVRLKVKKLVKGKKRLMATRALENDNGGEQPPKENGELQIEVVREREQARRQENKRVREILTIGARFNMTKEAQAAVEAETPLEDFMTTVLSSERVNAIPITKPEAIGMNQKEVRNYSILKAIRELSDINAGCKLTGLELECSQATAKIIKKDPEGFFIPREIMFGDRNYLERQISVTPPPGTGGGGFLVPTDLMLPVIAFLFNRLVVRQAGATVLSGLSGNIAIPKQTAANVAAWFEEAAPITPSIATFAQIALTPKRLSAATHYTRQLVIQSSPDIEALLRQDLASVMAVELDRAALFGSGTANQPIGIINQPGIKDWTFGTDPLYEGYIKGVVAIDDAKIPLENMAWIANPRCWGGVVGTLKFPNAASGGPILDPGNTVLGYPYLTTQQIPNTGANDGRVFFGNWAQLLIGIWDGTDVIVDPFTGAPNAIIKVFVHEWADLNVRYPEAFAVSTDAGYGTITFPLASGTKVNGPSEGHPPAIPNQKGK